jgi:hypothetical protein
LPVLRHAPLGPRGWRRNSERKCRERNAIGGTDKREGDGSTRIDYPTYDHTKETQKEKEQEVWTHKKQKQKQK